MGQLEEETPSRGGESPLSQDTRRSLSRSSSKNENVQPFEEISLDSPDLGEEKSMNSEKTEVNNNMKASYDVNKASKKKGKEGKEEAPETVPNKTVSYLQLFRFATRREVVLIIIGILSAIAGGCSMPVMIILFGQLADAFVSQSRTLQNSTDLSGCIDQNGDFNIALPTCDFDATNFTTDKDTFYSEISKFGTGASIIGVVNLICSYLFVTCLNHTAESQVGCGIKNRPEMPEINIALHWCV